MREFTTKNKVNMKEMVTEGVILVERFLRKLNASTGVPEHCCKARGKRLRTDIADVPG